MGVESGRQWHLERKVPVTLVFVILMQTMGFVYWGASFAVETENRLKQIERRLEGFATRDESVRRQVEEQGRTVAVLINRVDNTNDGLAALRSELQGTNSLIRELLRGRTTQE